jgi:hypothetical protein
MFQCVDALLNLAARRCRDDNGFAPARPDQPLCDPCETANRTHEQHSDDRLRPTRQRAQVLPQRDRAVQNAEDQPKQSRRQQREHGKQYQTKRTVDRRHVQRGRPVREVLRDYGRGGLRDENATEHWRRS